MTDTVNDTVTDPVNDNTSDTVTDNTSDTVTDTVSDTVTDAGTAAAGDAADGVADHTGPHGYISDKKRYLARLKRIEGQARGIGRMVEEEQYCIDILTQISALSSALEGVALGLLDDHLRHCVLDAARRGGPEADAKITEASQAIARLVKS